MKPPPGYNGTCGVCQNCIVIPYNPLGVCQKCLKRISEPEPKREGGIGELRDHVDEFIEMEPMFCPVCNVLRGQRFECIVRGRKTIAYEYFKHNCASRAYDSNIVTWRIV